MLLAMLVLVVLPLLASRGVSAAEYVRAQTPIPASVEEMQTTLDVSLEKEDWQNGAVRVGTLGRWNVVGELGALLEYREPFSVRIEKTGEILVLPAEAVAQVFRESPDVAQRLHRLSLRMMASKLEKASQTFTG